MKACAKYDVRRSLLAAGALEPAEAAEVEAHLAGCAACRAEADVDAAVLRAVRLPAPSDAERAALRDLPARTVGAFRAEERVRQRARRLALGGLAGLGVAAAALLAVAVPGPRAPSSTPTATPTSTSASASTSTPTSTSTSRPARWTTPDLDVLWDDTSVVALDRAAAASAYADPDAADAGELTATEVTLAAWDDLDL